MTTLITHSLARSLAHSHHLFISSFTRSTTATRSAVTDTSSPAFSIAFPSPQLVTQPTFPREDDYSYSLTHWQDVKVSEVISNNIHSKVESEVGVIEKVTEEGKSRKTRGS